MLTRTFQPKIIESFLLSVISDEEEVMPSFSFSVKQDYIHSYSFWNCRKTWERELFTFSCPWRHLINERESPVAKTDNDDTSCFYYGDFMGKSFTFDSRCGLRGVIHFILAKKGFITTCRLVRSCHAQICYNYIIVCSRTLTPFSSDGREVLYKV